MANFIYSIMKHNYLNYPTNYDLVLNSDRIGREKCVQLIQEYPPNTRIVNAKDLQNIIKYTGMKYFYQPIENIQSATVDKFAQGNTNVSFSPIPYNALSTQALYSDVNVQAMVEETIAEINNEFNSLKGNIKFSAVQTAFKNSLTDKKMYKDLSNTIVNMTSQSLDKACRINCLN